MRTIIFLLLLLGGWCRTVYGQIQFVGCGEVIENNYHGEVLYAIQDQTNTKPFGRIVFTPGEGGHPWRFSWTYNGIAQPVAESDTLQLEVSLLGNGFYTFQAERDGVVSQSAREFHVFFDHVPEFSIRLTDTLNCHAISIDEITDFQIPIYQYENRAPFEGAKTSVDYLVSDKTVPRTFPNYEYAFKPKEEAIAVDENDLTVTVTITDKFGFKWESKPADYVSVIPEAIPKLTLGNTVDVVGEVNDEMGQAPLEVEFDAANSKNADTYEWYLYKDTTDFVGVIAAAEDSLIGSQIRTQENFLYTYEHSGKYKVILVAINGKGNHCRDTSEIRYVNVVESLLEVPNVFTPNGDGKNDIFKVKALSLESFQAVIVNRWGRKVYEWNDPTGGWDGRIGGKYASPGTYFYIITAKGRERHNPPRYIKKGALLLVR